MDLIRKILFYFFKHEVLEGFVDSGWEYADQFGLSKCSPYMEDRKPYPGRTGIPFPNYGKTKHMIIMLI